ncbi:MAG TPA: hypothetical protein VGF90_02855, partial [Verrucomicrobiae bacterium]
RKRKSRNGWKAGGSNLPKRKKPQMDTGKQGSKADLRQKIRVALGKISLAVRLAESLDLCRRLEPQLQSAHAILFYAPLSDELDVWLLLEK